MGWWWWTACAWMGGLQELEALPPDFPLEVAAPTGRITTPSGGGQVAVDLVFESEAEARVAWQRLGEQAVSRGFAAGEQGRVGKRDRAVFEGPQGRVELSCCPKRADTSSLVFVSWWRPAP